MKNRTSTNGNELKQSITYEELGGITQLRRVPEEDNTPLNLDRYARRQIANSMVADEDVTDYPLSNQMSNHGRMLNSIILQYPIEEIQ